MLINTNKLCLFVMIAIVGGGPLAAAALDAGLKNPEEIELNRKQCVTTRDASACLFYGDATYAKARQAGLEGTLPANEARIGMNIALGWIEDACKLGAAQACQTVAQTYAEGRDGIEINAEKGQAFFQRACNADGKFCGGPGNATAGSADVCPEILVNAVKAMGSKSDFETRLDAEEVELERRRNAGDMSVNEDIQRYNRGRSAVNNGKCETMVAYAKLSRQTYCPSEITDALLAYAKDYSKGVIAGNANTSCFYSINTF